MSDDQSSLRQFGAAIEAEPLDALRRSRDDSDDASGPKYPGMRSRSLDEWGNDE